MEAKEVEANEAEAKEAEAKERKAEKERSNATAAALMPISKKIAPNYTRNVMRAGKLAT